MSVEYDVSPTPDIVGVRKHLTTVIPVRNYFSLFSDDPDIEVTIDESLNYDPGIASPSPVAQDTPGKNVEDLPPEDNPFIQPDDDSVIQNVQDVPEPVKVFDKDLSDLVFAPKEEPAEKPGKDASVMEASTATNDLPKVHVYGIPDKSKKPTKKEVIKAHLNQNSVFYNNLFYTDDFAKNLKLVDGFEFLDYFYPSFKIHSYITRTASAIGGLAEDESFGKLVAKGDPDEIKEYITVHYSASINWYKTSYTDVDHVAYCYKLYRTVENLIANKMEDGDLLIMQDWAAKVYRHYQLLSDCKPTSPSYMVQAQALHDLIWDPLDNPESIDVRATNALSLVKQINRTDDVKLGSLSEASSGEMINKEEVNAWIKQELSDEALESYYLLPSKNKYLIINSDSIRYAMDNITRVDPEDRKEYAENLNRLYYKFRPVLTISSDHPYTKYLNAGKYKIDPVDIVIPIIEGVVEDDSFDDEMEKQVPYHYRTVKMDYYHTVENLDPDHKLKTKDGMRSNESMGWN